MTTDDEAVAAAIDPRPQDGEPLDDYYSTPTRHLIAASDHIRALSARVAELEQHVLTNSEREARTIADALTLQANAEAKLREIATTLRIPSGRHPEMMADLWPRLLELAHTATQPEATPGREG